MSDQRVVVIGLTEISQPIVRRVLDWNVLPYCFQDLGAEGSSRDIAGVDSPPHRRKDHRPEEEPRSPWEAHWLERCP